MRGNKLNVTKTQSMHICMKHKHQNLNSSGLNLCLIIRGNELDVVQKGQYIGVYVNDSLDWKDNIKTASPKVSRALGLLIYAKTFLPTAL